MTFAGWIAAFLLALSGLGLIGIGLARLIREARYRRYRGRGRK